MEANINELIKNKYRSNYRLAVAEAEPDEDATTLHSLAIEWTIEDIAGAVVSVCDSLYWENQDIKNKEYYS